MNSAPQPTIRQAIVRDINEDYEFSQVLGEGTFGIVRLANYKHDSNHYEFVVKTMKKKLITQDIDVLCRECELLIEMDHPNIVKFFGVYEDAKAFHLLMEHCSGGELFDRVLAIGRLSEVEAVGLMKQILQALNFLHMHQIAHRDLKPENFMFETCRKVNLKMIDFGLSVKFSDNKGMKTPMDTIVGTPYYMAPEVLRGSYGPECDVWSVGVIMYVLLSGVYPFAGQSSKDTYKKILTGELRLKSKVWKGISDDAKDLIQKLLDRNVSGRATVAEALNHPWFTNNISSNVTTVSYDLMQRLKEQKVQTEMKRQAMSVLVKYLDLQELKHLREIFRVLDTEQDGTLTYKEIECALQKVGIHPSQKEIEQIINNIDYNGNGEINYSQFLAAALDSKLTLTEEHLWSVFKRFDLDNSGYITEDNMQIFMYQTGQDASKSVIRSIFEEVDFDSDHQISFKEFKHLMRDECSVN